MAVQSLIDPTAPIRNGDAVVGTGGSLTTTPQTYARPGVLSIASGDGLGLFQTLDSRYLAGPWAENAEPMPNSSLDTNTGSGAAAVLNYLPAGTGRQHLLYGFNYGYSAVPTNGSVSVQSPSGTYVWGPMPVTSAGLAGVDFPAPLHMPVGQGMLISLAGVSGVFATVSIKGRRVE